MPDLTEWTVPERVKLKASPFVAKEKGGPAFIAEPDDSGDYIHKDVLEKELRIASARLTEMIRSELNSIVLNALLRKK